jgi:16S rRNA G966 N2-methylase RsmD
LNKEILNTGVQNFIFKNLNADIVSVILKKSAFPDVSSKELAEQIEAKKKCAKKLPTWFKTKNIYYPNKLNIEQSSSEIAAEYKAKIVYGKSLIDLTGGLGIDSYFFSKKMGQVFHCEIDGNLSQIAAYNFEILGAENIDVFQTNGIESLKNSNQIYDWIYLDPSRRNDTKEKVFLLSDCTPNILVHIDWLFEKSNNILLKTSPLLDLSKGIEQLQFVKEIHIVAIKNEVKELLWVLNKKDQGSITVRTVNIKLDEEESFNFNWLDEQKTVSNIGQPLKYLYEPNAAILKSGAFKLTSKHFNLDKLNEHSHLYTSNELIDFPGRKFKINGVYNYGKKELNSLNIKKANIATRNFPKSVDTIRKLLKIKDGGDDYLFFTKCPNEKNIVLHCKKLPTKLKATGSYK